MIVDVPLNEAVVQLVEGVGRSFDSYTIALGACASNASEAASLARDFLGHQHQNANLDIGEVEVSEVPEAQIPTHVLDDAFAPIDEPGIYWASGRIFASGVGGRP